MIFRLDLRLFDICARNQNGQQQQQQQQQEGSEQQQQQRGGGGDGERAHSARLPQHVHGGGEGPVRHRQGHRPRAARAPQEDQRHAHRQPLGRQELLRQLVRRGDGAADRRRHRDAGLHARHQRQEARVPARQCHRSFVPAAEGVDRGSSNINAVLDRT